MDEQPVTYDGMEAVALNEPVIDFIGDDGQVLDLHNGGRVVRIEIEMPANLVVRLHVHRTGAVGGGSGARA